MNTIAQTLSTYDAIHAAINTRRPLHILYATGGDVIKARTIHPMRIAIGPRGSDLVHAEDDLRGRVLTFRIDRVVAVSATV